MEIRELSVAGAFEMTPTVHRRLPGRVPGVVPRRPVRRGHRSPVHARAGELPRSPRPARVRGVHFADVPPSQAKYVTCPRVRCVDVVVDIRRRVADVRPVGGGAARRRDRRGGLRLRGPRARVHGARGPDRDPVPLLGAVRARARARRAPARPGDRHRLADHGPRRPAAGAAAVRRRTPRRRPWPRPSGRAAPVVRRGAGLRGLAARLGCRAVGLVRPIPTAGSPSGRAGRRPQPAGASAGPRSATTSDRATGCSALAPWRLGRTRSCRSSTGPPGGGVVVEGGQPAGLPDEAPASGPSSSRPAPMRPTDLRRDAEHVQPGQGQHDHDAAADHRLGDPVGQPGAEEGAGGAAEDQRDQHRPLDAADQHVADRRGEHQRHGLHEVGADQPYRGQGRVEQQQRHHDQRARSRREVMPTSRPPSAPTSRVGTGRSFGSSCGSVLPPVT